MPVSAHCDKRISLTTVSDSDRVRHRADLSFYSTDLWFPSDGSIISFNARTFSGSNAGVTVTWRTRLLLVCRWARRGRRPAEDKEVLIARSGLGRVSCLGIRPSKSQVDQRTDLLVPDDVGVVENLLKLGRRLHGCVCSEIGPPSPYTGYSLAKARLYGLPHSYGAAQQRLQPLLQHCGLRGL